MLLAPNTVSYSNTNLPASTSYTYRVKAYDGPNASAPSNTASATTQPTPAAPSNVTALAVSSTAINLKWSDNATNESGFLLERATNGGAFSQIGSLGPNTATYANSNLTASTTYSYRIRAYDGPNISAYSNTAMATTFGPPAAPANLVATAVSSSRINLTWTDMSTTETGFKLERSLDGVTFSQIALLGANTTSYGNTGLPANTTYTFRIRSYEGANNSAYSNTASATTQPAPAAPSALTASPSGNGRIKVDWTDNATNESGFSLERSSDGISFSQIALLRPNTNSYSNAGLASGGTYYYRVRAYDGSNYSVYSNTASATAN